MTEDKEVASTENGQANANSENNEELSDLESSIIRQVEYYFGDLNLTRDKFLKEQTGLDDGWVPLDVMTKFNRLAKLTMDTDVIANALNKSTSGLLEITDDNKKVRRNPELPIPEMNEDRRKELSSRTIYAKGFPKDAVLDDVITFFKKFDEVENIIMRRYNDKQTKKKNFKGSVFATFKTKAQAEKFLENKDLKYNETVLIIMWQEEYVNKKQEEYVAMKEKKQKKIQEKEQKQVNEEKVNLKLPNGAVLFFSECNDKLTREKIKEALTSLGSDVAYIDFKSGDTQGWVRLSKENAAKELAEKITDGVVKIDETDIKFKLLEGEEEKAYLEKTVDEMAKRRKNMKNFKQHKGKNFRGKGNRKRKHDGNDDAPASKVKA